MRTPVELDIRYRRRAGLLAAMVALALVLVERWLFSGRFYFPLDDSYIHLAFARSLAGGEGLAFNPGVLVSGTTAPLWTALLALLELLPGSPFLAVKLAGIALHGATARATFDLARALDLAPRRAFAAAGVVAISGWLVWSAPSGMEVPLFVWLSLAGMVRHIRERARPPLAPLSLAIFALAALARPEGLMLLPLAVADRLFRVEDGAAGLRWARPAIRPALFGLFAAALILIPTGCAFLEMSGSIFPTTLLAKSSGPPILVPQLKFLRGVLGILFAAEPWWTLLALGGVVESARRWGSTKDRGLLPALWLLALPISSAMLSSGKEVAVGNFGRYFFPLLPVLVVLGMLALEPISFSRLRSPGNVPVAALAVLVLILPSVFGLVRTAGIYLTACANVRDSNVAAAEWLAPRIDPRALLAVNDIGAFRYFLPNPVLDLVGIVDPPIARRRRAGAMAGEDPTQVLREIVERNRPDYLVVFPGWFPLPERTPEMFPPLLRLRVPDNVAMAGDMIGAYATPWTRFALREPGARTASETKTETP